MTTVLRGTPEPRACTRCDEPLNIGRDGIPDPARAYRSMHYQHHGDPNVLLATRYRRARAHAWNEMPTRAIDALRRARYSLRDLEAEAGVTFGTPRGEAALQATATRDEFDLTVRVRYETETWDDDVFGTFDDSPGRWPDAVPTSGGDQRSTYRGYGREPEWYHPAEPWARYDWYRKLGASKATAYQWLRYALDKELRYARERTAYYVTVTASVHGIELGTASLGGLEYDDDDALAGTMEEQTASFLVEYDLIGEAIEDARRNLAELGSVLPDVEAAADAIEREVTR